MEQIITIDEIGKINCPVIYGLLSDDNTIFYVGRTKNLKNRMQCYIKPKHCHNKELADYLIKNQLKRIVILDLDPVDFKGSEKLHIEKHEGKIFNRISTDYDSWINYKAKPWHAGCGIKCPSSYLMWSVSKSNKIKIKDQFSDIIELINKMSVAKRCTFEISVYKDMHPELRKNLRKWFDLTCHKMIEVMEQEVYG